MFETEHFFTLESFVSESLSVLGLNTPAALHVSQCKVKLLDAIFHFCVHDFPVLFKTRKSIEEHKTGHMGTCESQTGPCCAASSALCLAVTGYFEVRLGKLGC